MQPTDTNSSPQFLSIAIILFTPVHRRWVRRGVERSGRDLISTNTPEFACKDWGETTKALVRIISIPVEIRTGCHPKGISCIFPTREALGVYEETGYHGPVCSKRNKRERHFGGISWASTFPLSDNLAQSTNRDHKARNLCLKVSTPWQGSTSTAAEFPQVYSF
jgi:hypothetical protein